MGSHAGWRMIQTRGWFSPHRPLHGRRRGKTRRVDYPSSRKNLGRQESASDETASVETTLVGITSIKISAGTSETTVKRYPGLSFPAQVGPCQKQESFVSAIR